MILFLFLLFSAISYQVCVMAGPIKEVSDVLQSHTPTSTLGALRDLRRRQIVSAAPTCGFKNGDPNQPRTAQLSFDCRVDTQDALWGFCPTTVISATDCGLAGNCVDSHACTSGCGIFGNPKITTFTCSDPGSNFCSSAILTAGPDQTYTYIACGATAETDHLLAAFTTDSEPTSTPTSSSSATPIPAATSTPKIFSTTSSTSASSTSPSISPASASSTAPSSSASFRSTSATSASALFTGNATITDTSKPPSSNTGAIVGGVIGGIALICFVALAFLFLRRNRAGRVEVSPKETVMPHACERYGEVPKKPRGGHGPVELPS